jgi:arabinogalactan oligomer/maltooligosaccharide transport system substrate-binding protein
MNSRRITTLLIAVVATLAAVVAGSVSGDAAAKPSATAAKQSQAGSLTVRIWTDRDREAAVRRVAQTWANRRGLQLDIVRKEFGDLRTDLRNVRLEDAPDVIVAAHDWTGELAANGLVVPLFPRRAVLKQFPKYAIDAFSYGRTTNRLYGAPVALENVGLVVNTRLAAVPKSFADLERRALAFKRRASGNLAIAVPQGQNGDAYHMYPFFSGLCGYVFGKTRNGTLNPRDIGLDAPAFLRNSTLIDSWNRRGLINSKVDYGTAKNAFLQRKAAYWLTGPWETDALKASGLRFRIVQVPKIRCNSVPFLGVQGFMVTKFSAQHGVGNAAKDLVGNYFMGPAPQTALAAANKRFPANTTSGRRVRDAVLKQFGTAGKGGIPMPNIPQMSAVWSELGGAWVKSTKGAGATKASNAFRSANRAIATKIG